MDELTWLRTCPRCMPGMADRGERTTGSSAARAGRGASRGPAAARTCRGDEAHAREERCRPTDKPFCCPSCGLADADLLPARRRGLGMTAWAPESHEPG